MAARATVDSLVYSKASDIEAAQILVNDQVPVGQYVVDEKADEFSLYKLRKRLGLKAVVSFEEFLQRLTPAKIQSQ